MRSPRLAPEEIVMEPATLQALRQRLRARALRTGPGRWRVPDDLVDFAFDTTIDGFLRGRYPLERLARTAIVILDHAARSGPDRRDLSARVLSLDSTARDWQTPIPKCSYSPQERATLESLLRSGVTTLTPHEQRAAIATLSATSQRAAAAATGMSLRNFRTRLARAERKLRRLTEREARGKIARLLDSCAGCCAPPPLYLTGRQFECCHKGSTWALPRLEKKRDTMKYQAFAVASAIVMCACLFGAETPHRNQHNLLESTWAGMLPQDPAPPTWECTDAFTCESCQYVSWVNEQGQGESAHRKCESDIVVRTCQGGTANDCSVTGPFVTHDCGVSSWFSDPLCLTPIPPPAGAPPCKYDGC